MLRSGNVTAREFDTVWGYDMLAIGVSYSFCTAVRLAKSGCYSGATGPTNVAVSTGTQITWDTGTGIASDGTQTADPRRTGWRLCMGDDGSTGTDDDSDFDLPVATIIAIIAVVYCCGVFLRHKLGWGNPEAQPHVHHATGFPSQPVQPPQTAAYPPQAPGGYPPHAPGAYPPQQPGVYPPQQQAGGYPPIAPGASYPLQPQQVGFPMGSVDAPPPSYNTVAKELSRESEL